MMEVRGHHLAGAALFKQYVRVYLYLYFFIYFWFFCKDTPCYTLSKLCWGEYGLCWFLSNCSAPQPSLLDSFEISGSQNCVEPPISHLTWISHSKGLEATPQCQTSLDRASTPACCWEGMGEEGKTIKTTLLGSLSHLESASTPGWVFILAHSRASGTELLQSNQTYL